MGTKKWNRNYVLKNKTKLRYTSTIDLEKDPPNNKSMACGWLLGQRRIRKKLLFVLPCICCIRHQEVLSSNGTTFCNQVLLYLINEWRLFHQIYIYIYNVIETDTWVLYFCHLNKKLLEGESEGTDCTPTKIKVFSKKILAGISVVYIIQYNICTDNDFLQIRKLVTETIAYNISTVTTPYCDPNYLTS